MLQAHSFLWHYLWVAPNILLFLLGMLLWIRGLQRHFPAFIAFAILGSIGQLAVYTADVAPSVSPETFWRFDWAGVLLEATLKFVLIGEIFGNVFGGYSSVARLGRSLIRAVGVLLVLGAAIAAAFTPKDGLFDIVSGVHRLEQTIYLIECGLLLFIFIFSTYFHLSWKRPVFGIALGLSISACVHLAAWAIVANAGLENSTRYHLDFGSMAVYHLCVLIWYFYLLVPQSAPLAAASDDSPGSLPASGPHGQDLDLWNRELERLLQ